MGHMGADGNRGGRPSRTAPRAGATPARVPGPPIIGTVQSSHMPNPELAGADLADGPALGDGADDVDVAAAVEFARNRLGGGDATDTRVLRHAMGTLGILRSLEVGPTAQVAAVLFGSPSRIPLREIQTRFGLEVSRLVE